MRTTEKLRRLAVPWHHVWRVAETLGAARPKRPVVFECVGLPGMLDGVIASAPLYSRVIVVGVCMEPDRIRPGMAINKEIDLRFVVGYTPLEFRDTLHMLANGKLNAAPIIGALAGVLLGVTAAGYWIVGLLAAIGAFVAGFEHSDWREGAVRGLQAAQCTAPHCSPCTRSRAPPPRSPSETSHRSWWSSQR